MAYAASSSVYSVSPAVAAATTISSSVKSLKTGANSGLLSGVDGARVACANVGLSAIRQIANRRKLFRTRVSPFERRAYPAQSDEDKRPRLREVDKREGRHDYDYRGADYPLGLH